MKSVFGSKSIFTQMEGSSVVNFGSKPPNINFWCETVSCGVYIILDVRTTCYKQSVFNTVLRFFFVANILIVFYC